MSVSYQGGCCCGAIRYQCTAESQLSLNCHCRDCQRAGGGAFSSIFIIDIDAFEVIEGDIKFYTKQSDAGKTVKRGFCGECGSQLIIEEPYRPKILLVHAGCLDDPTAHKPVMDIFASRANPWDPMDDAIEKFSEMPPIPDSFGT